MKKIRYGMIALSLMLCSVSFAAAELNIGIGIGLPNVSIGINLPLYPELVPVPGYPVYYAPQVNGNYFFYDGMYWVYQDDNWYTSSWYNGPWGIVAPEVVPLFVLRIPVRYYRQPPVYFSGWQSNLAPHWGQHWGNGWEQRRSGWDKWKRNATPARAPLPAYQRQYAGDRYPHAEQQHSLRTQSYRYQPRDKTVRQHLQQQGGQKASAAAQRGKQEDSQLKNLREQQGQHRPQPLQQGAPADPHSQPPQRGGEFAQRPDADNAAQQQRGPAQREQHSPRAQGQEQRQQERGGSPESNRGRGNEQKNDDERGRGR